MQPAGSVDNNNIGVSCLACLNCIKNNRRGIRAFRRFDQIDIRSVCPDLKLLYRRSPECIRCAQYNASALLLEPERSLPIVVVLPTPFTPITRITEGLVRSFK